jgi:hypothetical protein
MTGSPHSDFCLDAYRTLIGNLLQSGYEARDYADVDANLRHVILRHDVDMCLDSAVRLARVEADMGVHSWYFVLMRSELYNTLAPASIECLQTIAALGHRIGVHVDAAHYGSEREALEHGVAEECAWAENALGQPVEMISFHRPSQALLGDEHAIAGRAHSYQPRYFSALGYCSDSRGRWAHGHPLQHEAVQAGRALQLLTHPIWWTGETGSDPVQRLQAFVAERLQRLHQVLARECSVHQVPDDGHAAAHRVACEVD